MGIKEQLIFPEINYDDVDMIKGMNIVFTTTAKTDEELSDREFEQKYGYFFGYCYDFGKSHATSSDPT